MGKDTYLKNVRYIKEKVKGLQYFKFNILSYIGHFQWIMHQLEQTSFQCLSDSIERIKKINIYWRSRQGQKILKMRALEKNKCSVFKPHIYAFQEL